MDPQNATRDSRSQDHVERAAQDSQRPNCAAGLDFGATGSRRTEGGEDGGARIAPDRATLTDGEPGCRICGKAPRDAGTLPRRRREKLDRQRQAILFVAMLTSAYASVTQGTASCLIAAFAVLLLLIDSWGDTFEVGDES